jgi:hypothetical protein
LNAHYAAESSDIANNTDALELPPPPPHPQYALAMASSANASRYARSALGDLQYRPPHCHISYDSSSSTEPWRSSFSHPTRSTPFDPNPKMQDQENDSKKAKDEGWKRRFFRVCSLRIIQLTHLGFSSSLPCLSSVRLDVFIIIIIFFFFDWSLAFLHRSPSHFQILNRLPCQM